MQLQRKDTPFFPLHCFPPIKIPPPQKKSKPQNICILWGRELRDESRQAGWYVEIWVQCLLQNSGWHHSVQSPETTFPAPLWLFQEVWSLTLMYFLLPSFSSPSLFFTPHRRRRRRRMCSTRDPCPPSHPHHTCTQSVLGFWVPKQ